MSLRVGVDIGGTFTDFCFFDEDSNALRTLKVLSTPDRPGDEIVRGLKELTARYGVQPSEIGYFTHGTTVGVNTVIQRKGINLCLFTTENFGDVLELARLKMPDPYDLFSRRPVPLVTKEKVFQIRERLRADGSVETPVEEASVQRAIDGVRSVGGEGVVIALLHAYRNADHEHRVRDLLAKHAPDLSVTCSSDVWPVIREYERTVTAVIAGYVQPRIADYLASLQAALAAAGVSAAPMVTKSNGGVMSAEAAKSACVHTLLSGPASGVMGASYIARRTASESTMSLDVGGTSADVAFIHGGEPQFGVEEMVGEFPLHVPTISVTSIGSGGGSIAWVDGQGVLKVGPESAGSSPGPACYGLGGERPTLTDAFAVCGYLGADELGYGAVRMRPDLAHEAVAGIAHAIGRDVAAAAEAIINVAVSQMYLEVSKLASRHGFDLRDFTLQAFGGAGPMIACFVARELGMRRIIIPLAPGVLCAFGGLVSDVKSDFIKTVYRELDDELAPLLKLEFGALGDRALAWLRDEQSFDGEAVLTYSADMRYRGQAFEIETILEQSWIVEGRLERIADAFHDEHERVFGHADHEAGVQVINLRLVVAGRPPKPEFAPLPPSTDAPGPAARAEIHCDGGVQRAGIFDRPNLHPGQRIEGPAIIRQDDCTTCILADFSGTVAETGDIVITMKD